MRPFIRFLDSACRWAKEVKVENPLCPEAMETMYRVLERCWPPTRIVHCWSIRVLTPSWVEAARAIDWTALSDQDTLALHVEINDMILWMERIAEKRGWLCRWLLERGYFELRDLAYDFALATPHIDELTRRVLESHIPPSFGDGVPKCHFEQCGECDSLTCVGEDGWSNCSNGECPSKREISK